MNRRTLLKYSLGVGASLLNPLATMSCNPHHFSFREKPAFSMSLCATRVGIDATQEQLIELAKGNGFASVEPIIWDLKSYDANKATALKSKLAESKLTWGCAELPVDFRQSEKAYQTDLQNLPAIAKILQAAGVTRVGTWIMPCDAVLTYRANFRQHSKRLKEIAQVLEQHGLRLGLEYVGTKAIWASMKFPFLHTMAETMELIAVIGQNNVGLVLDSWHLTSAGENAEEILKLENANVVAVDLCDAPASIDLNTQSQLARELPMATGRIDIKAFLQALVDIKYDGPIRAEPFNQVVDDMDNQTAAKTTVEAMKKAFAT
ncbi:MAG: sugar phosphate isomerase/epimerase, partial [Mariniblastus sp.]